GTRRVIPPASVLTEVRRVDVVVTRLEAGDPLVIVARITHGDVTAPERLHHGELVSRPAAPAEDHGFIYHQRTALGVLKFDAIVAIREERVPDHYVVVPALTGDVLAAGRPPFLGEPHRISDFGERDAQYLVLRTKRLYLGRLEREPGASLGPRVIGAAPA